MTYIPDTFFHFPTPFYACNPDIGMLFRHVVVPITDFTIRTRIYISL